MNEINPREAYILRLERTANLLKQNPEIPAPSVGTYGVMWHLYTWEHEDVRAVAATIRRLLGGKWDKKADEGRGRMEFTHDDYKITVDREAVCTRRIVATEKVTLPAVKAQPARTVEREVVEWDCEPLLAARENADVRESVSA